MEAVASLLAMAQKGSAPCFIGMASVCREAVEPKRAPHSSGSVKLFGLRGVHESQEEPELASLIEANARDNGVDL